MKEYITLYIHNTKQHPGEEADNRLEIIKTNITAFHGQTSESVWIQTNPTTYPLNRKSELNGNIIPKLLVKENGNIKQTNLER